MYSTRGALALLWRCAIGDASGVQLWSPDELACAQELHRAGLGEHGVRFVPKDGKMVESNFFTASERGLSVWEHLLITLQERVDEGRHV